MLPYLCLSDVAWDWLFRLFLALVDIIDCCICQAIHLISLCYYKLTLFFRWRRDVSSPSTLVHVWLFSQRATYFPVLFSLWLFGVQACQYILNHSFPSFFLLDQFSYLLKLSFYWLYSFLFQEVILYYAFFCNLPILYAWLFWHHSMSYHHNLYWALKKANSKNSLRAW